MRFPRYESYKDSGVEWLGEIPRHWQVKRNIGIFDERKKVNRPEMDLLSVTINQGIIQQNEITTKKDSSNEDKTKYKVVEKGDLAYNKMRMWQGAIGASSYDGIVSPAYIILRPRDKAYSRYYHYLYRTPLFIKEANRHSYGLCDDMNSLRYEHFKTIYSSVPPSDEIDKITNFLDQKTAEIDEAIAKKEQLITLLQEQKAILINQAVTKGLNPNAPMKDSGVEWLGAIPAHWEIMQNRRVLTKIEQGYSPAITNSTSSNKYNVLKISAVKKGFFEEEETKAIPAKEYRPHFQIEQGDLLLTRGNTPDLVGDVCFVEKQPQIVSMLSDLIYRLTYNPKKARHDFMVLFLLSKFARDQIAMSARGSSHTMVKVGQSHIKTWIIALPPPHEQLEIVASFNKQKIKLEQIEQITRKQISQLQLLKTTYIAEVSTGKLKI